MKYVIIFSVLFFLAVISQSALPHFKLLGVTPNLLLVFVICWNMLRGQRDGMWIALMAGLLADFTGSGPIGRSVAAFAPIVAFSAARDVKVVDSNFISTLAVVALATISYMIISMLVWTVTGEEIAWLTVLTRKLAPAVIVNMLITGVIYLPLNWYSQSLRSPIPRFGTI
ncbi:MAG TPA: rod shape-determining protein MreD [Dehalococcoidia bacterium]|nr:rod shape-determining protein MreD [Dehalococcoidia bacterium]